MPGLKLLFRLLSSQLLYITLYSALSMWNDLFNSPQMRGVSSRLSIARFVTVMYVFCRPQANVRKAFPSDYFLALVHLVIT